jgi:hypothetical protein
VIISTFFPFFRGEKRILLLTNKVTFVSNVMLSLVRETSHYRVPRKLCQLRDLMRYAIAFSSLVDDLPFRELVPSLNRFIDGEPKS